MTALHDLLSSPDGIVAWLHHVGTGSRESGVAGILLTWPQNPIEWLALSASGNTDRSMTGKVLSANDTDQPANLKTANVQQEGRRSASSQTAGVCSKYSSRCFRLNYLGFLQRASGVAWRGTTVDMALKSFSDPGEVNTSTVPD